jgi:hypothetical protein
MHLGDQISKRDTSGYGSFGIVSTTIIIMITLLLMTLLLMVNIIFKVFTNVLIMYFKVFTGKSFCHHQSKIAGVVRYCEHLAMHLDDEIGKHDSTGYYSFCIVNTVIILMMTLLIMTYL